MALNPPLTDYGEPLRVEGEFFIMKRKGIEFEVKVQKGNKYTGKGIVYTSSLKKIFSFLKIKKQKKSLLT